MRPRINQHESYFLTAVHIYELTVWEIIQILFIGSNQNHNIVWMFDLDRKDSLYKIKYYQYELKNMNDIYNSRSNL